jgi:hypothetical protein
MEDIGTPQPQSKIAPVSNQNASEKIQPEAGGSGASVLPPAEVSGIAMIIGFVCGPDCEIC